MHLNQDCRDIRCVWQHRAEPSGQSRAGLLVHGLELRVTLVLAVHLSEQDQRLEIRPGYLARLGEKSWQAIHPLQVEPH